MRYVAFRQVRGLGKPVKGYTLWFMSWHPAGLRQMMTAMGELRVLVG